MKYFVAVVFLIHGLIHLIGLAKAWNSASVTTLTQPVSVTHGIVWGVAALLLSLSGIALLAGRLWWWMPGLAGLLISQALIFGMWSDARFGTLANLLLLLPLLSGYGKWSFEQDSAKARQAIVASRLQEKSLLSENDLQNLPPLVRRWVERSGAIGKPRYAIAVSEQEGTMRTSPEGKWMPFTARQYTSAEPASFLWLARVAMAPGLWLGGRDRYEQGKGQMLIKLQGLYPVVDSEGPEIDQGTLLRFLGEMVWFPAAAVGDYLKWEQLDASRVRAKMSYQGTSASGIFTFDAEGRFVSFEAARYYAQGGQEARLQDWLIEADAFAEFEGVEVPSRVRIIWKLEEGDFEWFRMQLKGLEYRTAEKP